jgi:hypothetical protein
VDRPASRALPQWASSHSSGNGAHGALNENSLRIQAPSFKVQHPMVTSYQINDLSSYVLETLMLYD